MDVIEFIGFIIIMIASVILSFKRKQEKKESLDIFEQFDKEMEKSMKEPVDEEEEEYEEFEEEFEVEEKKPQMPPPKPVVVKPVTPQMPLPAQGIPKITTLKKDNVFDMHNEAFAIKKKDKHEASQILGKLKSLQDAVVIQALLDKPRGM